MHVPLLELWLPIVLSAVFVFIGSFLFWMVSPHHKADIKMLPDEKSLTDHLKSLSIPPGLYMWPNCQKSADMKSDDFKARYEAGPWGSINIMGSKPNFVRNLVLSFVVYLVISVFVGYITSLAAPAGTDYRMIFRIAGATAVLGYCAGGLCGAFFMGKPMRFILTDLFDGVIYGLLTAGTFGWLWPQIEMPL